MEEGILGERNPVRVQVSKKGRGGGKSLGPKKEEGYRAASQSNMGSSSPRWCWKGYLELDCGGRRMPS